MNPLFQNFWLLADESGDYFWKAMPPGRSTFAQSVDDLYYLIFYISTFFFVAIVGAMCYFAWRYRHQEGKKPEKSASHNNPLEITWSVLPSFLLILFFVEGFHHYMDMRNPPEFSYKINVQAKKWNWSFVYPNGLSTDVLHMPVDRPVELIMESSDVLHALYVPVFRAKQDIVPGRFTHLWFEAIEPGEFNLFCAEYCGDKHSSMITKVVVHEPGLFEKWLDDEKAKEDDMPPVQLGERLYKARGCVQCHSIDGTNTEKYPSFKGLFGKEETISTGEKVKVDENYIQESILEPQAKIVKGYPGTMPSFKGQLNEKQIRGLIAYIESLK